MLISFFDESEKLAVSENKSVNLELINETSSLIATSSSALNASKIIGTIMPVVGAILMGALNSTKGKK